MSKDNHLFLQTYFIFSFINHDDMGIIGLGVGAIGSIYGGIKASQAMNNARNNIKTAQRENQDLYDRRYNEDATMRGDALRALQMTEDSFKKRNRQVAGTQAVMGGTNETVAAEKAANANAMANATGQVVAQQEARKDAIESRYLANKEALNEQMNQMEMNKANAISEAIKGVTSAAGEMDFGEVKLKNGKTLSL